MESVDASAENSVGIKAREGFLEDLEVVREDLLGRFVHVGDVEIAIDHHHGRLGVVDCGLESRDFPLLAAIVGDVVPLEGVADQFALGVYDGRDVQREREFAHGDISGIWHPSHVGENGSLVCWIFVEAVDAGADQARHGEARKDALEHGFVLGQDI